MSEPEAQLKKLVNARGHSKQSITRIANFLADKDQVARATRQSLITKKDRLVEVFVTYSDLCNDIEVLDPSDKECYDDIEDRYLDALTQLNSLIAALATSSSDTGTYKSVEERTRQAPRHNLPQIKIPKFNGSVGNYHDYINLFTSVIHNDIGLPQCDKLYYLRSTLEGEAADIVKHLTLSGENYEVALRLLKERYDNKAKIVTFHVNSILDLRPISRCASEQLRDLVSKTKQHLGALKNHDIPVDHWDTIIVAILQRKLDQYSLRAFHLEAHRENNDLPTLDSLLKFIEQRAAALETVAETNDNKSGTDNSRQGTSKGSVCKSLASTRSPSPSLPKCTYCDSATHKIFGCQVFKLLAPEKRIVFVESKKLCKIYLNEHAKKCRFCFKCAVCKEKHNTLLHSESTDRCENPLDKTNTVTLAANNCENVLLPTVRVKLYNKDGSVVYTRALLDSGSQVSFIRSDLANKIDCEFYEDNSVIKGVCGGLNSIEQKARVKVFSTCNNFNINVDCCVVNKITSDLPQFKVNKHTIKIPSHIQLADRDFNKCEQIGILLGCDIFFQTLEREQFPLMFGSLFLQNTRFGYIVAGKVLSKENANFNEACNLTINSPRDLSRDFTAMSEINNDKDLNSLSDTMGQFWKCEDVNESFLEANTEQELAEKIFCDSVTLENSRFQVKLPLKQDLEKLNLGDSISCALQRFYNLEKRFSKDDDLFQRYKSFVDEYVALGHAEYYDISRYNFDQGQVYFLPHHPVINEDAKTTKLRVVFDGSMPTKQKVSLNDVMLRGPKVQRDLFDILVLFRLYKYILISDIKKMFRQVYIEPSHRALQNILWRHDKKDNVQCIQLKTITYGLKSSSFLATRCLEELACRFKNQFPLGASVLQNNTYVDDIFCGSNDLSELGEIKRQVVQLLKLGGFELHKWCANEESLLNDVPKNERVLGDIDLCKNDDLNTNVKTLGVSYNVQNDKLTITCPENKSKSTYTKRELLSFVSKIFDPLGLIGPIVVNAKLLMQEAWIEKVPWDNPLPSDLNKRFKSFVENLIEMSQIVVPRNINTHEADSIEVVGFADASNKAYGCCIYLRIIAKDGSVSVRFLCSKSRVNPINRELTTPRLELNSGLLLAILVKRVHDILSLSFDVKVFLYLDSQIVLAWLKSEAVKLGVYVSNRIKRITELTSQFSWHYVNTQHNPADCLSRGVNPTSLQSNDLWWYGPTFLQDKEYAHVVNDNFETETAETVSEVKTCNISNNCDSQQDNIFNRYSDIKRMKKIVAYLKRFIENCRRKVEDRSLGNLSPSELYDALLTIVRYDQRKYFHEDIRCLEQGKQLKSNLNALKPFVDGIGLLRVGGRLQNADLTYDQKYPIILPKRSIITHYIIQNEHKKLLHAGQRLVLSNLNQRFYIINGLREVKCVIHKCIICFKLKAKNAEQLMGSLPVDRIKPARVFETVGIDYGGPFNVKLHRVRKPIIYKAYIVLFVCFVTKAVHIELVTDMTTECFLSCLKRFMARRNKPSIIYCDNASTFKGAQNELIRLYQLNTTTNHQDVVQNECADLGINFKFIPAYSPVFGGLWEAGIKSAKYHIKRVVGTTVLTYEEMNTVMIQVEGVLNSRPLTALSTDPNDMTYLTPAHFLTGASLNTYPEPNLTSKVSNRLTFWRQCTKMLQCFWEQWKKQYLVQLQNRPKWRTESPNITIGTLVLLKDDNCPPLFWPTARVVDTFPGKDGLVRALSVRTSRGTLIRTSVGKVCVLPMQ